MPPAMDNLLNVESFSIKDAAQQLEHCYGEYLLHPHEDQSTGMADVILMSCLVCTMNEVASRLTTLNTLAMT